MCNEFRSEQYSVDFGVDEIASNLENIVNARRSALPTCQWRVLQGPSLTFGWLRSSSLAFFGFRSLWCGTPSSTWKATLTETLTATLVDVLTRPYCQSAHRFCRPKC